jgi:hypothetical protein
VQEELPLKPINRGIIWREKKKSKERGKDSAVEQKKEGWQLEEKKHKLSPLQTINHVFFYL